MITELNCYKEIEKENDEIEREYFGIEVTPTDSLNNAIEEAGNLEGDGETYVCGYYVDGICYGDGE